MPVDEGDERLQARVSDGHAAIALELGPVALGAAGSGEAGLQGGEVGGDIEGRSGRPQVAVELGQEDVHPRQVKVPEVHVEVGDGLEPACQIPGLGVAGHQQKGRNAVSAILLPNLFPHGRLALGKAEVLHVLHTDDQSVRRDPKRKEVTDIDKAAGAGAQQELALSQPNTQRADDIHREPRARPHRHGLGVTEKLHLRSTGIGARQHRRRLLKLVRLQAPNAKIHIERRPGHHLQGLPTPPDNAGNTALQQQIVHHVGREPAERHRLPLP